MSFLESFLGGAAGAGAGIISQQMKDEQELKAREQLARLNEELYTQREKTVLGLREAMDIRAEERKAEPLKRMGSLVGKYQNEEVPMEAEKATTTKGIINRETMLGVDGKPIQSAGPGDRGLATGIGNKDFNSMRQQIINDPNVSDEDRAGVLAQIDAQERQQQEANNAAVQGKTRKRTSDEAMGLARDEAMSTDPAALAAWEQSIGRPMRDEKKLERQQEAAFRKEINTDKALTLKEREQARKEEQGAKALEIQQERLNKALQGIGDGGDSAKIKTANVYLDRVNAEREKQGMEPLTFEQAYKQSNYAERDDVGAKSRQAIAATLLKDNPGLSKKPEELKKQIDSIEAVIGRNAKTETPKAPEAPKTDNYVVGKKYRDKNGNTATYMGNGQWK